MKKIDKIQKKISCIFDLFPKRVHGPTKGIRHYSEHSPVQLKNFLSHARIF